MADDTDSEAICYLIKSMFLSIERLDTFIYCWINKQEKSMSVREIVLWFVQHIMEMEKTPAGIRRRNTRFKCADGYLHIFRNSALRIPLNLLNEPELLLLRHMMTTERVHRYFAKIVIHRQNADDVQYTDFLFNAKLRDIIPRDVICARFLALVLCDIVNNKGRQSAACVFEAVNQMRAALVQLQLMYRSGDTDLLPELFLCMDVVDYRVDSILRGWTKQSSLLPPSISELSPKTVKSLEFV